jgi:hypothetical protein
MKYLLYFFIGLFLVFFTLNYFNNSSRKKNKEKLEVKTLELDSLMIKNELLTVYVKNLEESKQKVDTFYIDISDSTRKVYEKRIKSATSVVYLDTTNKDVKQLIDSVRTDDLKLDYVADYIGEIYGIDFTWTVKERTIVKENIVKVPEPYPVEKLVPINKRALYVGAYISSNTFYPNYTLVYVTKKKSLYSLSYEPVDNIYSFGIGLKLLSF